MKKLFLIFLCLLPGLSVFSQKTFNADDLLKPDAAPKTLVNDYSGTLTADQQQTLEQKLVAYDDSTSTQITVVLVPDLSGNDVSDFSFKLGRAWGVGGSKFNNGIVFLISVGENKMEIATGYGAEGALPDVTCKNILDNVVRPEFKTNDYYRGIDAGTTAIMQAMRGEYVAPEGYNSSSSSKSHFPWGTIIFIIIIIVMGILRGGGGGGGLASTLFWGSMLGGGGSGGSSSWSGGGGGGGGFGGFGGGSFGGGGASGSW